MTHSHLAAGDGQTVVVGVKLDAQSKELLTWCLLKVLKPGDRVIAVHVMDHNEGINPDGKSSVFSVVGAFDSVLTVYEGFCNLKQVGLKLKICRGSSIGKILVREAQSYSASKLILGTSSEDHKKRSSASVAKYCAKKLTKNCSVLAVNNGKIIYEREASTHMAKKTRAQKGSIKHQTNTLLSMLSRSASFRLNLNSGVNGKGENSTNIGLEKCAICSSTEGHGLGKEDSMKISQKSQAASCSTSVCFKVKEIHETRDSRSLLEQMLSSPGTVVPLIIQSSKDQDAANLHLDLEAFHERYSSTCRLFTYQELQSATSNFAPEYLIGRGGSSQVYRGSFPNDKESAVKILRKSEDIYKEFVSEIEIITSLHHRNIISVLGFCFEGSNLLLVYNLQPRGSLEENLHGSKKDSAVFGWNERYKVAVGVAEALNYLHECNDHQPVIHRDVKSSNILLSEDFEPQLSDFGLARWASTSTQNTITDIAGTFGYLAPEYFMYGKVTEKIDVYAYGVVLIELLSGRKPISNDHPKGQESLVMWAKPKLNREKMTELLDISSGLNHNHDTMEKMVLAANLCIRRSPHARPKMNLVLKLIQGDMEAMKWARMQVNTIDDGLDQSLCDEGYSRRSSIQCHLNVALLDVEE